MVFKLGILFSHRKAMSLIFVLCIALCHVYAAFLSLVVTKNAFLFFFNIIIYIKDNFPWVKKYFACNNVDSVLSVACLFYPRVHPMLSLFEQSFRAYFFMKKTDRLSHGNFLTGINKVLRW